MDRECGPACNQELGMLKMYKFGSCDPAWPEAVASLWEARRVVSPE